MERKAALERKTAETNIQVSIQIDGRGNSTVTTGIGFFDHMLTLLAKHGLLDLNVMAEGDLVVDAHHTVEDVGIVLGQAIKQALGDKKSIKRYGTVFLPMDETLAMVSLDISGRPFLVFDAAFTTEKTGQMETQLFEEFFRALAFHAGITLHIKVLYGTNSHHMAEAIFKAFGRALDEAVQTDSRIEGVLSTKGSL